MEDVKKEEFSQTIIDLFELEPNADTGETHSEKRRLKRENKKKSDEILKKYGINVHKFSPIHYRFEGYDYWPTTTKWMKYKKTNKKTVYIKKESGYGIEKLLERLELSI